MKKTTWFWNLFKTGRLTTPQEISAAALVSKRRGDAPSKPFDRFMGEYANSQLWDASGNLRAPSVMFEEWYLSYHERADWQFVKPQIQRFAGGLCLAARAVGIPLYCHTAYRTPDKQWEMVAKGVSRTKPPLAAHPQGCAVDIVHAVHHWNMSENEWAYIGRLGQDVARKLAIPIEWGGDWSDPWDPAHWELQNWRALALNTLPRASPLPIRRTPRKLIDINR